MMPVTVRMSWFAVGGGTVAMLLVVGLVAALFSGRVWAVLVGLVGTLLLVVGGLMLLGTLYFVRVRVQMAVPETAVEARSREQSSGRTSEELPSGGLPGHQHGADALEDRPTSASAQLTAGVIAESPVNDAKVPPIGAPRPTWMDGQMGRIGDVYRTTVKVGPAFSRTECEKQLPRALDDAVGTYADHLLGEGRGQFIHLPAAYIRNHLLRNEWEEQRETTYDTMFILHELLEFDREANEAIEANYRQSVVMGRLAYTATGGGVVLGLLTILFGYLKLDTLSRGYYTGRLRFTAVAAILALAAVAGLLAIG